MLWNHLYHSLMFMPNIAMNLRISYLIRWPCLLNLFNYKVDLIVRNGCNYVKVVME